MSFKENKALRKKCRRKILDNISLKELIHKKSDLEKNLKKSLFELSDFVETSEAPFFHETNKEFYRLDKNYNKYREDINLINHRLPINYRINSSGYDVLYKQIDDKIEHKNSIYMKSEYKKIQNQKNPPVLPPTKFGCLFVGFF